MAELVQKQDRVPIAPGKKDIGTFTFRGGSTVIIDRQGRVRYAITKPIDGARGKARLERQREFVRRLGDSFALAPYLKFDLARDFNLRGIHRGY